MRTPVLVAVHAPVEGEIVAALDAPGTGVQVVRRCADLAEVTALTIAGVGRIAVLGSGLPGVDRASLARLRAAGSRVLLLADDRELTRCRALGAEAVLELDAPVDGVVQAAQACARTAAAPAARSTTRDVLERAEPDTTAAAAAALAGSRVAALGEEPADGQQSLGKVVAVWGPHGSPGRTSIAVNLAAELAALGEQALLVDADTWGGCVGQTLGLLDEAPGLAAAARSAANGLLEATELDRLCSVVEPRLRVLTGLTRPDRWRELAPTGLDHIWTTARELVDWTVVDCGFCLEDEAGSGFEAMLGPRRNGATLGALAAADVVIAVGAAEPVGIQRLVTGLADLAELGVPAPGARRVVVVNRVRASAAGPRPERAVTEALGRYAGVIDPALVPDDRTALDKAMLEGATLRVAAPSSPARAAIAAVAADLTGRPLRAVAPTGGSRWRRRPRG